MLPFAYVYYYLLALNMKIPTPSELTNTYIEMFCKKNEDNTYLFKEEYLISTYNIKFSLVELKARILRAYNSYNREIEFFVHLSTKLQNKAIVKYDMIKDLYEGIDMVVETKSGNIYGLATYVGTSRSMNYKYKKNTIRHDYSCYNMLDVIAYMYGPNKNVVAYGDVLVYNDSVVNDIVRKII